MYPRKKLSGDQEDTPGVRSYNVRPAHERYDVYCYMDQIKGEYKVIYDNTIDIYCIFNRL